MPYQSGFRREPSLREALVIFFMVFCMVFVTNLLNSVSDCQFVLRFTYVSAFQVPPGYVSSLRWRDICARLVTSSSF